jgi:spermidine/putrescine transport system substrate-binding protein
MDRDLPPLTLPLLRGTLSRRTLFRGAGAVGLATLLAACGTEAQAPKSAGDRAAEDKSDQDKVVNWSNWPEYIDVDEASGKHPSLEAFTAATGIAVKYNEDYNDNDEFFAKVQPQLSGGQDTGRDVWCSTDWLVARLIRLGWVQELDKGNMPNVEKNLEDSLADVQFDPGRKFSLPWQSGFTGIGYNPDATGGKKVESMDQLLTDPALKGRVTLLTEMRDTVGLVLLALGKDPADFTDADFDEAIAELQKARDAGQIRGFTGNDYTSGLASGEIAACVAWTGDVVQLKADNPKLGYVLPSTGHMLWSDNFVIPNQAAHKQNAEKLIDFYYDPEVFKDVAAYVNYIPPVKGTKEALTADDPDTADNPLIFPDEEVRARSNVFRGLTEEEETKYNEKFQSLIGA